jgi:selenocysteine lyase/cysteine desulfurase
VSDLTLGTRFRGRISTLLGHSGSALGTALHAPKQPLRRAVGWCDPRYWYEQSVRASAHYYNDESEVERFVRAVAG